jgi:hypothetical protein
MDLFGNEEPIIEKDSWEQHWFGMPEFKQEDLTSFRKIVIHFRNDEDVKNFAELIGQKITPKQPSLWYPEMQPRRYAHLRYVKEDE